VTRRKPQWPDPTEWLQSLAAELEPRAAKYHRETDTLDRRNIAAAMLGHVAGALARLPSFYDQGLHYPLKDIVIFFSDLEKGRLHPWRAPDNYGGTNSTTTAEGEMRLYAKGVVTALKAAGLGPVQAYKVVADALTDSGRQGAVRDNKLQSVSWRSVQTWFLSETPPKHAHLLDRVVAWWGDFEKMSAARPGKNDIEKLAKTFARQVFKKPLLRDRFHPIRPG
jgi:hypothetical protein